MNTLSASIAAGETGPLITLSGSVDITNHAELSEVLADPRVNGTLHLTIDASGLSFADSMATRALALTAKILKERGGGMVLLSPHTAIQHERAAAAGFGDKDEHERQAAIHRAADVADTQRAERANRCSRTKRPMMIADQTRAKHLNRNYVCRDSELSGGAEVLRFPGWFVVFTW